MFSALCELSLPPLCCTACSALHCGTYTVEVIFGGKHYNLNAYSYLSTPVSTASGIGASVFLADLVYNVPANVILDSARRTLSGFDVITSIIKAWVFGSIISVVSQTLNVPTVVRLHCTAAAQLDWVFLCLFKQALLSCTMPCLSWVYMFLMSTLCAGVLLMSIIHMFCVAAVNQH